MVCEELLSFEQGLCCSMVYRVWAFISCGKKCVALGTFSFVLKSKTCGCQPRNAMKGMGCTGEADQTSKAGQFLRLHHSTRKRLHIQFFELLEASAA